VAGQASFRAVFFDLGGTLFSYRSIGKWTAPVLIEAARRLGIESEPREIGRAYSKASRAVNLRYVDQPFYMHRDLFRDTFRAFAAEFEREATSDWLDRFEASMRSSIVDNMKLRDDCLDTLARLQDRGMITAIVSNIDDDHLVPMVENSGLDAVLDHWTSSEEARSCKPDSGFFHVALAKAECRVEEVLFVGDSREHDVQGARRVGMKCALIAEPGAPALLQTGRVRLDADYEIEALAELLEIVGDS